MKKMFLTLVLLIATMAASASNTLYFTYNQTLRAVSLLNNEDELMIYCGYEDELPTYVLINDVWAEQISSSFYEIWLYGYDAYTGEEVYMPIDMECIWLVNRGNIYSAAQTLRFRSSHPRPTFVWAMPPYNPWVRGPHPVTFYYSYHYDIHRPGWHYHNYPHIHPYYRRMPGHPAPMPPSPFTPGRNMPGYHSNPNGGYEYDPIPVTGDITASRSNTAVQNDPTSRSGNRVTSTRGTNNVTTTDRISGSRSTTTAPVVNRSNANSRGNNSDNSRSNVNSRSNNSDNSRSNVNSRNENTNTNSRSNVNSRNESTNTNSRSNVNSRNENTNTNSRSNVNSRNESTNTNSRSNVNSRNESTNTNSRSNAATTPSNSRSTSATSSSNTRSNAATSTATSSNTRSNSTSSKSNSRSNTSSSSSRSSAASSSSTSRSSDSPAASNSRGNASATNSRTTR